MIRTVCLDFDGVLHQYDGKWLGEDQVTGCAVPDSIAAVMGYLDAQLQICVMSTRSRTASGRFAMASFLCARGLPVEWDDCPSPGVQGDALWDNRSGKVRFPYTKPPAWVYIDDRNWPPWDGKFPDAEQILAFRPWHQRKQTK